MPASPTDVAQRFTTDGLISPVRVVDRDVAHAHRRRLETAEAVLGPLHYQDKVHTVLGSAWELATNPNALDVVEACIGPDICVYNATYIIKEPDTAAYVSWHQDLTYWDLADDDAQVSMWLALSPATVEAGCMSMIPGSHTQGRRDHAEQEDDPANVLYLGQHIAALDTDDAVACPLAPGEASFHHGWTIHASSPNTGTDRRIGLNVQYVAPHNRHLNAPDAKAIVVRGEDHHGFFGTDEPATADADPATIAPWRERAAAMQRNFGG